ncbi:FAD-dependent oxidoreductase [Aurantimonas sp. 22II-16-19i]|uniref:FAD-dependent oxidoreductase n=1 Tax=Aurantimonas sp. 22II-16-19i TaxID=1317114 RepID=UPI0009F7E9BB|nr:FAD-dependent oxidoreductase [Aurantimonas sp. 22II-16-19i]ORE91120.1 thiamine biosynthesis oxidoreductase thiO [Aurantimonas sp. 22II-16-19i]
MQGRQNQLSATVIGAGVAGLCTAVTLAERGASVTVHERSARLGDAAASWLAGGMLAPFCEAESADHSIVEPGIAAIEWWESRVPDVMRNGTLVVASGRDAGEIARFGRRTSGAQPLDAEGIEALEPDLAGRFRQGLHFADEAHLDPRRALAALAERFARLGGTIRFGCDIKPETAEGDVVLDCRGIAGDDPELRSLRGEMLVLRSHDVRLSRPVRLLHPRWPIYVVPRGDGHFMVGATMIESEASGGPTLRSAVELMNAAYALHPAFAEAEVIEMKAGRRPAFPDNLPKVTRRGRIVSVNGLYRHGFLLAPDCAAKAADLALGTNTREEIAA